MCMSTKTLSIRTEVYTKLLHAKHRGESFSDVLDKLVSRKKKLSDSFGKWAVSKGEWGKSRKELDKMWKHWGKDLE